MLAQVDDLDRALLQRLRASGRTSSRALAAELAVAEKTIRARLRRLADESIMRVTALTDTEAFGHEFLAVAKLRVAGQSAVQVGEKLAEKPETIGVFLTTGRYDLIASLLARDRAHLATLLGDTLPTVSGVDIVHTELALEVLKFESSYASFGTEELPTEPWEVSDRVDQTDLALVEQLREDARRSNRSIAARLGVSEGMVRYRLRRMETENIIRIQAVCDVSAFGYLAFAYLGIQVLGGHVDETAAALKVHPSVPVLLRTLGEYELMCVIQATDRQALTDLIAEIGGLRGVRRTEAFESLRQVKHSYTWAKLA
jgi:Lrp/AsnC family transcriptional regulator for asnA, asnC and gidA